MSLNGKIADQEGKVDWLEAIPNPDHDDYGYAEFYDSIGTTIQGYTTYQQIIDWDIPFPYAGKENFVLTRKKDLKFNDDVQFISAEPLGFIKALKKEEGQDVWLIGGGQVNTLLWDEGLIDELIVFVMPIVLDGGIDLFEGFPKRNQLKLIESKGLNSGAVMLHYML